MSGKQRSNKTKYIPKSRAEIKALAIEARARFNLHTSHAPNFHSLISLLSTAYPEIRIKFVSDILLPHADARAYPSAKLIRFRQGVKQGLLRGDSRTNWTFAHELGHVLCGHPKRPFRYRAERVEEASGARHRKPNKIDQFMALLEEEAHYFAAEFIAPTDLALKFHSVEQLRLNFNLSSEAARRRFDEIEDHKIDVVKRSILETIASHRGPSGSMLAPFKNNLDGAALLTLCASHLLIDAFESMRPNRLSSTSLVAASVAAAIATVQPIRGKSLLQVPLHLISSANQDCAFRTAAALLQVKTNLLDAELKVSLCRVSMELLEGGFLKQLVMTSEGLIKNSSTQISRGQFPSYSEYNTIYDIPWCDLHPLERIANLFELLDLAFNKSQDQVL